MYGRAPFLNGCLHLLPDADENGEYPDYIAVLDLDSEIYKAPILVPEAFDDSHSTAHIALLGGLLTLCRSRDQPISSIQIWVLKAYDVKTWFLQYSINVSLLIDDPVSYLGVVAVPLVLMPDGKILLNVWGMNQVRLLLYDSHSNKVVQRLETDSAAVLYSERYFSFTAGVCNHAFHFHCISKWLKDPTSVSFGQ